jgi:hypothetical protein
MLQLINDFTYLSNNYFSHPSYLEINGRKAVFFDAFKIFVGDDEYSLDRLRESVKITNYI